MLRRTKRLTHFVRYIEVLFDILYYYWGHENHSLYRGLRYIERGPLYLGSTVHEYYSKTKCAVPEPCSTLANLTQNPRPTSCLDV